jgi:hypothetical protein
VGPQFIVDAYQERGYSPMNLTGTTRVAEIAIVVPKISSGMKMLSP